MTGGTPAPAGATRPATLDRRALNRATLARQLLLERSLLVAAAREIVEERPRVASELGRLLAERFPGRDPVALAQGARAWLPMVQIPPRGVWGRSGRALQVPVESWLGRPQAALPVERLVLRYLAAFGPATVRDVQTWCGLTRLAEVLDALRPGLRVFSGADGAELFDLPDAPRPDPDVPAPVRYLYDYDNLLLSHNDRSRVFGDSGDTDYGAHGYRQDSNLQPSSVLVDGMVTATWTVVRERGTAVLNVRGFRQLTTAERADVEAEGAAMLRFLRPGDTHDIRVS